jgi:hypothetical protein
VIPIRFDLIKRAYAIIYTENGRGPFTVLSKSDLETFLKQYADRKIETYVFIKGEKR